jgi:hypothetical protein
MVTATVNVTFKIFIKIKQSSLLNINQLFSRIPL